MKEYNVINNEICVDDPNMLFIPQVEIEPGWIAHVRCEGARFHVLSYGRKWDGTAYIQCSEPKCIINKAEGR